jgi:hypothetical protein
MVIEISEKYISLYIVHNRVCCCIHRARHPDIRRSIYQVLSQHEFTKYYAVVYWTYIDPGRNDIGRFIAFESVLFWENVHLDQEEAMAGRLRITYGFLAGLKFLSCYGSRFFRHIDPIDDTA